MQFFAQVLFLRETRIIWVSLRTENPEPGTENFLEFALPLAIKLALEPNGGQERRR